MRSLTLAALCVFGTSVHAQIAPSQEHGPQRTTSTARPQSAPEAPSDPAGASEAYIRTIVGSYRQSWERMNARMRKTMLSHGGQTPDQYERSLRQSMATIPAATQDQPITPARNLRAPSLSRAPESGGLNAGVLNSMQNSGEDLNTLRDANLQRVQKGGCAPELMLRVAELKGRLAALEGSGSIAPSNAKSAPADWFKTAADRKPSDEPKSAVSQQLDSVLGSTAQETPAPEPVRRANRNEAEIAATRAELDETSRACPPQVPNVRENK